MGDFWRYVAALVPSTGVGFLFYLIIKAMIEGDRRERRALALWEAAHPETRTDVTELPHATQENIECAGPGNASDEAATGAEAHAEPTPDTSDATVAQRTSEQE